MISKNDARILVEQEDKRKERRLRGFINRAEERSYLHPKRKFNCRKSTRGRLKYRDVIK